MSSLEERVKQALGTVQDPDLKQDLITLGMVKDLRVEGRKVCFTLVLTTPACPLQELLKKRCLQAIHTQVAAELLVSIQITAQVKAPPRQSILLPHVKNIVAIASGKGGVGKSTLSVNVALALAACGAQVGLLDADFFGPSIPTMLGCETQSPPRSADGKPLPLQKHGIKFLSMGLLMPAEEPLTWRGPMAGKALKQLLGDTQWGALDYLLVDLPPGTSDIALTLAESIAPTGVVIVTTPQRVALADVTKMLAMCRKTKIAMPVLGMVENMAYFTPPDAPHRKYYLFGQGGGQRLASQHRIPFLGEIPLIEAIRTGGDDGQPIVLQQSASSSSFTQIAQRLAQQIAIASEKSLERPHAG